MSLARVPSRRSWAPRVGVAALGLGLAGLGIGALPQRGEVPEAVMDRIVADISRRTGRDVASVEGYYRLTEVRSDAVTWDNGRLGCERAGASPAEQEPIAGYWVVLQIGARTFDYRIADEQLVLCPPRGTDADGR